MFTSLEHQMLRHMTKKKKKKTCRVRRGEKVSKKKTWRVYGEKVSQKTGITRRYYRCLECEQARTCIMHTDGVHVQTKSIAPHAPSCQNRHHP